MSEERIDKILRLILFSCIMLLINEMASIGISLFTGDLRALVGTGLFFLNFLLMYLTVLGFLNWEGQTSISSIGADIEDKQLLPHVIIGAITAIVSVLLIAGLALFFGGDLRPLSYINADLITGEIIIALLTSFFEELCYRGYLTPRAVGIWGKTKGIVISSLVFSLLHFSWWTPLGSVPVHLIFLFTLNMAIGGAVLSISYYLSGEKLWVPIGFHFGWNVLGYLLFPRFPIEPVTAPEIYQIEWGVTTILGFLLGLSLIWILLNETNRKKK
jgi:membrane protease YdiL (CAAX protease family)